MKSRFRSSVWRSVFCQGSVPWSTSTRPYLVPSFSGSGGKDVAQGGAAEVNVQEQGPLAGPGAGRGHVQRGGALAVAGLGAGDQQGDDRTATVGNAKQAGPDVAERVGLDRVGRAGSPEVAPSMGQSRSADPGHDAQQAAR